MHVAGRKALNRINSYFQFEHGMNSVFSVALLSLVSLFISPAYSKILSPVAATTSSYNSTFYDIGNTIDQSGLSIGFTSGVDDFDAYFAHDPRHATLAMNNEWFTSTGVISATISYDLGDTFTVDRFAIWNEEAAGVGQFDLLSSVDGVNFASVLTSVAPTDHPNINYPADIYLFTPVNARYFRLDVSDCPQPNGSGAQLCAIGEVAFDGVAYLPAPSPVPGPFSILGGAAAFGFSRKLRRRITTCKGRPLKRKGD